MRIAMGHVDEYNPTVARFARQLGLRSIHLHNPSSLRGDDGYWTFDELDALRNRCALDGLEVEAIENVPHRHFWKIQQGLPGRDEQIENYHRTIQNMARAGITVLGYNFIPTYVWRTDTDAEGRGGARVTSFDLELALRNGNALRYPNLSPEHAVAAPISADQMWDNYGYFLRAVLPVAEAAGVTLALHPDDPPVTEALGGAARIFGDPRAVLRAAGLAGASPAWALTLCLGTVSEMGGQQAVDEVIDALGPNGRIAYVHFRDVRGNREKFAECFLGEGNIDPARTMTRLRDSGFDGFLIDDHVPAFDSDAGTWVRTDPEAYCSRGRTHAIGYLQGLLNAIQPGS